MKLAALLLPLLTAAALAEECGDRSCGCAGCGTVAHVPFVEKGDVATATAPGWG